MTRSELSELIYHGENSGVEFKRDKVRPENLAKDIVALANFRGGYILLGVEDDGTISGLKREPSKVEEWVMNICRSLVYPPIIPYWEVVRNYEPDKHIGIIFLPSDCPDKPYKVKLGSYWVTYIRVGSTSREATREEEARLYQSGGLLRYDLKPVPGTSLSDLDLQRVKNYFEVFREALTPLPQKEKEWISLLENTEIMAESREQPMVTVGGLLLFGKKPHKFLPQCGITAVAYKGEEKDYEVKDEEIIRGPLVSLFDKQRNIIEAGVIDRAFEFVKRNLKVTTLKDSRREEDYLLPLEAVREIIINAVAHRDYTIYSVDIEISIFSNRLEVISPGLLPNTITVEKIKYGCRAARNELIRDILRDYGYIEARGMGIPYKVLAVLRRLEYPEPEFIEDRDGQHFIVKLFYK